MYYGGIGEDTPSRPSYSSSIGKKNPYQKIEDQMEMRMTAFRNWVQACIQASRDLYATLGQRPNQEWSARNHPGVVEQITSSLDEMQTGEWFQGTKSYPAKFILTTLDGRESTDPVLVEKARMLLLCYTNMKKALKKQLEESRSSIEATLSGSPLSSTVGAIGGLLNLCEMIWRSYAVECHNSNFPEYDRLLQQKKTQWERDRAQALEDEAAAEAAAAEAARQAQALAQAAAASSAAVARAEAERRAAAEAAAAAASEAQRRAAESMARAAQEAAARATARATEQAAAAAAAAAAAEEEEDRADEAAAVVAAMDAEGEEIEAAAERTEFPWMLVALGGVAVIGVGTAIYLSSKGARP